MQIGIIVGVMPSLVNNLFLLFVVLTASCHAEQYRVDYEWSDDAGGWLKYHAVPATWDDARLRCFAEGAILASPLNNQLKKAIADFAEKNSQIETHIFTGVHAIFSKGDYASIEGVPLLRLAITWEEDEPDNFKNSESCLAMSILENDYSNMRDTRCDRVLPYVCYQKAAKLEMTECGTTDQKYVKENRTGSCYKYHEVGMPWPQAYKTCAAEGGHLAIINNDVEAVVVRDIISKHTSFVAAYERGHTYVGVHDWGTHGVNFMTIHGETLKDNYHTWYSGEPNNVSRTGIGEGQFCGSVSNDARLEDYFCDVPTGFLCEKLPKSLVNDAIESNLLSKVTKKTSKKK